jgi:CobQ-like glutamine amidotransferase family enzyme
VRRGLSTLVVAHIFPRLLGLYGDRGNATVLVERARSRGVSVRLLIVEPGDVVPRQADIYLLGGAEDVAQVAATRLLRDDGGLAHAAAAGAVVLAVCAGLQILGTEFEAAGGRVPGLGLVDAVTVQAGARAVGELLTEPEQLPIPMLTGFENHAGRTTLGPGVAPLGRVVSGTGNGAVTRGDGARRGDGFVQGRIIGTYLHGPALARNPALADLLLEWATGTTLIPLDDRTAHALRAERFASVLTARHARRLAAEHRQRTGTA